MASWLVGGMRALRGAASGTAIAIACTSGTALAQEFPGDLWTVNYVKVSGADQAAVRSGLKSAADRVFYGDEVETHLQANVNDGGTFDVSIIGPGGAVLARQNGLSYSPGANAARSVSEAALNWMGGLSCGDGCAVAVSAPPPAPVETQVAAVEETPTEPVVVEAPKPAEPAVETATVDTTPIETVTETAPVEVAAKPIVIEPQRATAPEVKAPAKPVEVARSTSGAIPPQGLDADAVLARPNVAAAPRPSSAASAKPVATAQVRTPSVPKARIETPVIAAAPAAGASGSAPSGASASTVAPTIAAAPQAASVPEVTVAEPTPEVETDVAATVETEVETAQPEVAVVQPTVSVEPAEPEVRTDVAAVQPQPSTEQEVAPGVTLPAPVAGPTPSVSEIAGTTTETAAAAAAAATTAAVSVLPTPEAPAADAQDSDGDGEQLALVNPRQETTPTAPRIEEPAITPAEAAAITEPQPTVAAPTATETTEPVNETETGTTVETQVASVDPTAEGPTLANARWVGFTPAVYTGSDNKAGAWIAGPFDRKERSGWITDTATGATTRVQFVWRESGQGSRTAVLSREAARALGLGQGDVANVAVYLPR